MLRTGEDDSLWNLQGKAKGKEHGCFFFKQNSAKGRTTHKKLLGKAKYAYFTLTAKYYAWSNRLLNHYLSVAHFPPSFL